MVISLQSKIAKQAQTGTGAWIYFFSLMPIFYLVLSSAVRAESAAVAAGRESCPLSIHIHLPWSDGNQGREMQSSTDL